MRFLKRRQARLCGHGTVPNAHPVPRETKVTDTGLNFAAAKAFWADDANALGAVLTSAPTLRQPALTAIVSALWNNRDQLAFRRLFVILPIKANSGSIPKPPKKTFPVVAGCRRRRLDLREMQCPSASSASGLVS